MVDDFMHDQLADGCSYQLFKVIDYLKRDDLAIETEFSLPTLRVIRTLNQLLEWRTKPLEIRCDNESELISHEFIEWAKMHRLCIDYIQPDKPQQNAYIERYNKTTRYS